jgi:hypothetical protein
MLLEDVMTTKHTKQLAGTIVHELFKSHIYLITDKGDPLASKNIITDEDIYGRTLMVGGGSSALLRSCAPSSKNSCHQGKSAISTVPTTKLPLPMSLQAAGSALLPVF